MSVIMTLHLFVLFFINIFVIVVICRDAKYLLVLLYSAQKVIKICRKHAEI